MPKVKVKPIVLCIALKETFKESAWYKDVTGYRKMKDNTTNMRYGQSGKIKKSGSDCF